MGDKIPPTGPVSDDLWVLNFGFVSSYVLRAPQALAVFDTGLGAAAMERELGRLGLSPEAVNAVFLTHSDGDHTGGLGAFPQAQVFLPRAEEPLIDGTTPRMFGFWKNSLKGRPYTPLDDGQKVELGPWTIACLGTPGHTTGSMSYLIGGRFLIAGDILNLKKGRAVMDQGLLQMDKIKQLASIFRLARLDHIEVLAAMHSGFTRDFAYAMDPWREEARP